MAIQAEPAQGAQEAAKAPRQAKDQENNKEAAVPAVLGEEQMAAGLAAFRKLVALREEEEKEKDLLGGASGEGRKVQVQVAAIKLPRVSEAQILKIVLPHHHTPPSRDVCLIVKDLERGIKAEHEGTVAHYTALLRERGVQGVARVLALRELKVEFKTFEAKRQLAQLYDVFLADARIVRLLPKFLGKAFYQGRKPPVQVDLGKKALAAEVGRGVRTATLPLSHAGTSSTLTIGLTTMPPAELQANLAAAVRAIEAKFPGGWGNVRSVHLLSGTSSLPLYMTLRAVKEVGLVRGLKRKNKGLVTDELSTVVGATVTVTPTGGVKVRRTRDPLWTEDQPLEELTNELAGAEPEEKEESKEKTKKNKKEKKEKKEKKKEADDVESEDEMEDKEMAYMQKIADEEEEMEKKIEATEDELGEKLKATEEEDSDEEEEEKADDDVEAEDLLSEGEDSDSEDELIMKNQHNDEDDEEDETPAKKPKKINKKKALKEAKAQAKSPKQKSPATKKTQKQKKFIEQKKKAKLAKMKK